MFNLIFKRITIVLIGFTVRTSIGPFSVEPIAIAKLRAGVGMNHKGLRAALVAHGVITAAAGLVLTLAPGLIPSVAGIYLAPNGYVLAYLLAGAEFGFSALSFGSSGVTDTRALRLVVWTCIVFHASSGILEVYAYAQGASVAILANVAARAVVVGIFAYLSPGRG
jgi:hypothetical protein